jgi:pilus assembly protein Flp/PilA
MNGMEAMIQVDMLHSTIRRELMRFRRDESGATAIEYALVAAGVGGAVITTVLSLGTTLKTTFYDKIGGIF